jgi:hypothetical protein
MAKRASVVLATMLLTMLVGGIVRADPPDPNNGATKPVREQNLDGQGWIQIHEQGIADVDIQNENLNVTLQNQELDVNVTNDSLPIEGDVGVNNFPSNQDVSVTNFPSTQNVNVTGGSVGNAPVTTLNQHIFNVPDGETEDQTFDSIAVSSILIVSGSDEYELHGGSPLTGSDLFLTYDPSGDEEATSLEFPNPIPLNRLTLICANESDNCAIAILLAGFPV